MILQTIWLHIQAQTQEMQTNDLFLTSSKKCNVLTPCTKKSKTIIDHFDLMIRNKIKMKF